jgi:hypothetical protein
MPQHDWYYHKEGQKLGPVSAGELKRLAASGELRAEDLVFREGLADWTPAGRVKGLFPSAAVPAPAAAPVPAGGRVMVRQPAQANRQPAQADRQPPRAAPLQASPPSAPAPEPSLPAAPPPLQAAPAAVPAAVPADPIAYYNPTGGVGARTAAILKNLPPPTGSRTDWPLDDARLNELKAAESHRRHIRRATGLYNVLGVLSAIGTVVALVLVLMIFTAPRGSRSGGGDMTAAVVVLAISVGVTALYFFCARATINCRSWAPLTMVVLFSLAVVAYLSVGLAAVVRTERLDDALPVIPAMLIAGLFLYMSIRAFTAIPRFLAQPVWCQEALLFAKL